MTNSIYDFSVENMAGGQVSLGAYRGQVVMIVNTASKCGFTGQYDGLQRLYEKYRERGFVILGFPANDFLWQEPGSNEEIASFCRLNYGVKFPVFAKMSVRGRQIHPLYKYLTEKATNPEFAGRITWNFNKFLIGRNGRIINRFGTRTAPDAPEVVAAIEAALGAEAAGGREPEVRGQ